MKKMFLAVLAILVSATVATAKGDKDSLSIAIAKQEKFIDSVDNAMKYQTGSITLPNGIAKLNVSKGFKYLNAEQSNFIISDIWGNPKRNDILGMIFPENSGPYGQQSYAFIISYDASGFVKDDDADKINYDDMLMQMQVDEVEDNKARVAQGYPSIHMAGWASKPFYDKTNKVLHWAKNLHFSDASDSEANTLNYEVRILGRKGVLSMNAVATLDELDSVKKDINTILAMPSFTDGNTYKDFDSKTDNVAAWTIGGLVAGKILLKVGFWGIIVKFLAVAWKFILLGIAAIWGVIKRFFGRKPLVEEDHSVPQ